MDVRTRARNHIQPLDKKHTHTHTHTNICSGLFGSDRKATTKMDERAGRRESGKASRFGLPRWTCNREANQLGSCWPCICVELDDGRCVWTERRVE